MFIVVGNGHDIEEPLSQGDRGNSFPSSHALRIFTVGALWTYKTFRIPFLAFALFASFLIVYVYMWALIMSRILLWAVLLGYCLDTQLISI